MQRFIIDSNGIVQRYNLTQHTTSQRPTLILTNSQLRVHHWIYLHKDILPHNTILYTASTQQDIDGVNFSKIYYYTPSYPIHNDEELYKIREYLAVIGLEQYSESPEK